MRIDILTIFPEICRVPLSESIMKRAQASGVLDLHIHDLRGWSTDRHRTVDDTPYGGGPGMVMKPEPLFVAVESLRGPCSRTILLTPAAPRFDQGTARRLAGEKHLLLVCGHYEGIDERVTDHLADECLSIGDYVLTNGAIAAAVVTDAIVRLLPGALGDETSAVSESFSGDLLDFPHYTRPPVFRGWAVPEVLLSGNHAAIAKWRKEQSEAKTRRYRPDLPGGG